MKDMIEKVVDLAAPISRVWRALTDYEEFGRWFRVKLDGPFRVGEITRGRMTYPGYEDMPWESITVRMDREPEGAGEQEPEASAGRLFSFYWPAEAVESAIDDPAIARTLVEFRLEAIPGGTRLTITESGFASVPDPRRIEMFRENTRGWNEQAENIAAYVES